MAHRFDKDTGFCMSISARPSHFGIRFHNFLYDELGLNFVYKSFAASDAGSFDDGIRAMTALGIRGCGISMPFKEHALQWAEVQGPGVARMGAINTLVNEQGRLIGWNTDYFAAKELLSQIKTEPAQTSVLLLGSGGMARAIACALSDLGFRQTVIASRNAETGRKLAGDFAFRWQDSKISSAAEILINATPIGMAPHHGANDPLPFGPEQVAAAKWVIDAVAFPQETRLIKLSRDL